MVIVTGQAHTTTITPPAGSLLERIQAALREKGALDIIAIDLRGKSSLADYMVVATGTSSTHVSTLADQVERACDEVAMPVLSVEGRSPGDWALVDTPEVIVHLFRPTVREQFDLESMWGDVATGDDGDVELIG